MNAICSIYKQVTDKIEEIDQMLILSPIVYDECSKSDLEKIMKRFISITEYNFIENFRNKATPRYRGCYHEYGDYISRELGVQIDLYRLYYFLYHFFSEWQGSQYYDTITIENDNPLHEKLLQVQREFVTFQYTYQLLCKPDREFIISLIKNMKGENSINGEIQTESDYIFDIIVNYIPFHIVNINNKIEKFCLLISTEFSNFQRISKKIDAIPQLSPDSIVSFSNLQQMRGYTFEKFLHILFRKMGYSSILTKKSGDQGCDLIISDGITTIAIQAKNHKSNIGNTAIQEIRSAVDHYKAHKGMVIVTSNYTKSAKELASSNSIELINGIELSKIMQFFPVKFEELNRSQFEE